MSLSRREMSFIPYILSQIFYRFVFADFPKFLQCVNLFRHILSSVLFRFSITFYDARKPQNVFFAPHPCSTPFLAGRNILRLPFFVCQDIFPLRIDNQFILCFCLCSSNNTYFCSKSFCLLFYILV